MSIRVANDAGEEFWFSIVNWRRMLAFASLHGWPTNAALEPDNWDESLPFNDKYEIVGRAAVTQGDALALADAIDRGIRDDPRAASDLERTAPHVREKLPTYDAQDQAIALLNDWSRFRDFARGRALRIDLTD